MNLDEIYIIVNFSQEYTIDQSEYCNLVSYFTDEILTHNPQNRNICTEDVSN